MKIIGKVVKWYLISDTIAIAWIGVGYVIHYVAKHPGESIIDAGINIVNITSKRWKLFLDSLRNGV